MMEMVLINKCTLADIDKIKKLGETTFYETFANENSKEDMEQYLKENFSYERLQKEIMNDHMLYWIATYEEEPVAYMKLNFEQAQTEAGYACSLEIQRIYVLANYKGKHIGKALIQKAIEIGKEHSLKYLWLGVWEYNLPAIKFYEKQGFQIFDSHLFQLGNDVQKDHLMKLELL